MVLFFEVGSFDPPELSEPFLNMWQAHFGASAKNILFLHSAVKNNGTLLKLD